MSAHVRFDRAPLAALRRRRGIRSRAFFVSESRGDVRPDTDLDVLVEMLPGLLPGLEPFALRGELPELLGRHVDLRTPRFPGPSTRDRALAAARAQHVAA